MFLLLVLANKKTTKNDYFFGISFKSRVSQIKKKNFLEKIKIVKSKVNISKSTNISNSFLVLSLYSFNFTRSHSISCCVFSIPIQFFNCLSVVFCISREFKFQWKWNLLRCLHSVFCANFTFFVLNKGKQKINNFSRAVLRLYRLKGIAKMKCSSLDPAI